MNYLSITVVIVLSLLILGAIWLTNSAIPLLALFFMRDILQGIMSLESYLAQSAAEDEADQMEDNAMGFLP